MKETVNSAMVLLKMLKERLAELRNLRTSVATDRTTTMPWGDEGKRIEEIKVKYDIKLLDKKVTEIEYACFKIDSSIKQSNAKTEIEMPGIDVEKLLSPLE